MVDQPAAQMVGGLTVLMVVAVTLAVWIGIGRRWVAGQPLAPYEPRRRVPWTGSDVLAIFGVYIALILCISWLADGLLRRVPIAPPVEDASVLPQANAEDIRRAHPIVQLLHEGRGLGVLILAVASGIVMAPIAEEVLFRVVLQGWLERVEGRLRRRMAISRRLVPGVLSVAISSLLFASLHYRPPDQTPPPARQIAYSLAAFMLANLLATAFALVWLRCRAGATAADLGLDRIRLVGDAWTGVLTFIAIAVPIFVLQAALTSWLPDTVPDPITLFFFAAALGFLYYRTHRLAPPLALHMALNGTSLVICFAGWATG